MRQVFAIVIAVLAIAGTAYLVSNRLSNPDHYQPYGGGVCADQVYIMSPVQGGRPCRPPTRATWQVPLAVAIAILGLGAAVKVDAAPGVTFAMAT
jgi:hypothetical protein